jgi:spermidine/putrescine transport system ATP-binding protein
VTDASFTGVSTQYLVRMPWGQELVAFAQNTGGTGVLAPGTQVDLSWEPAHTFALDGSQDASAGVPTESSAPPVAVG